MQPDLPPSDDPAEIAGYLVSQNGLDGARQIAVEGTTQANMEGDYYRLSVWREIKAILREWREPAA